MAVAAEGGETLSSLMRRSDLAMYAEGIAARKIERLLHVSHTAVLGWVRMEVAGKALQAPAAKDLSVIEADEM